MPFASEERRKEYQREYHLNNRDKTAERQRRFKQKSNKPGNKPYFPGNKPSDKPGAKQIRNRYIPSSCEVVVEYGEF